MNERKCPGADPFCDVINPGSRPVTLRGPWIIPVYLLKKYAAVRDKRILKGLASLQAF